MEDRIKKFMDYKGITASELADTIGVQRSNVTHILKARNKPSFQFIEKLLQIYPDLNAKWLIVGTGNMVDSPSKSRTLFDSVPEQINTKITTPQDKVTEEKKSSELKPDIDALIQPELKTNSDELKDEKKVPNHEIQDQFFSTEKPIERLIVFYNDQTFKVYNPSR